MGHIPLSPTLTYFLVSNYLGSKIWNHLSKLSSILIDWGLQMPFAFWESPGTLKDASEQVSRALLRNHDVILVSGHLGCYYGPNAFFFLPTKSGMKSNECFPCGGTDGLWITYRVLFSLTPGCLGRVLRTLPICAMQPSPSTPPISSSSFFPPLSTPFFSMIIAMHTKNVLWFLF